MVYGDDAVYHKEDKKICSKEIKRSKNKMSGSVNVECKQNEAYGGVGAGYKVIREVALALQEVSVSSDVSVLPNEAYKSHQI